MKSKTLKEIALPAIMLFIIATISTALLAGTNLLTKDKIAELAIKSENEAKAAVIDAVAFSDAIELDGNTYYEAYSESNELIGYVFNVSTKSYGGELVCMVGISAAEEKITGVEITSISDTPGLGMKADSDSWLSQFKGKSAGITVNKNTASDTEIQAITSATITSQAVTTAVNQAFDVLSLINGGAENV